ncbi:FeoB-associated Cys-rich membrane protein [Apibacter mensalis]|nr:FeoB-associated Cys-rich membrane protein [Apibacter mensalis]
MNIYLQYAFIALTLLVAVWYLIKLFRETFFSKKKKCGGGVNCKCGRE